MTCWTPPVRSQLPLAGVARALGRANYGYDLYWERGVWHLEVDRLVRRSDCWTKARVLTAQADTDWEAVLLLPRPTLAVRLALIGMYLGA